MRYVLWRYGKGGVALFFDSPANQGNGLGAHILGEPNMYFTPTNGVFSGPNDEPNLDAQEKEGIQWDIDRQPCP